MESGAATPEQAPEPAPIATQPLVLVSGGSEGIGLAIAERFAQRRKRLLLVARTADTLDAAADMLTREYGATVATLALDLTRPDALDALDRHLAELGCHVEVLVNNAGVGHCGTFADMPEASLRQLLAVNVEAPARLMRHLLPGMRARRTGGIINVASLGAYVPGPYQAAYYASKAFLVSLGEAVAAEVHRDGITVSTVVPGPVATRFHDRMGAANALYLRLVPGQSARSVAGWAMRGHDLGLRVVVPGFLNLLGFAALRLLPHGILIPIMAALLHPRTASGEGGSGDV